MTSVTPLPKLEPPPSSTARPRDPRVDFFRGVTLLWMLTSHIAFAGPIPAPLVFRIVPSGWGYTSALEVFLFLSGLVFGIVHRHTQEERGFWVSELKAAHRASRLFVMNAVTLVLVLAIASAFIAHSPRLRLVRLLPLFLAQPEQVFAGVLQLEFAGYLFRILPLYMKLLIVMPAVLWLMRRSAVLAMVLSVLVYATTQVHRIEAAEEGVFDVPAYQLLFTLGMLSGIGGLRDVGRSRLTTWMAAGLVITIAAGRLLSPIIVRAGLTFEAWDAVLPAITGRANLGVLRIVHFLAAVCLIRALTRRDGAFWRGRLARPFILCGERTLEVFCFGVVCTYIGMFVLYRPTDAYGATLAMVLLASYAGSIGFAWYLDLASRKSIA